ncbi:MAG: YhjD/YihY/BrkB family envelope integrity protein [Isosphaeraceae bacterium]
MPGRVKPARRRAWQWSAKCAVTDLFRFYVQNLGSYNKSLGALGGVIVLLSWFWVVALVLLGAAEMDRVIEAGPRVGKTR